MNGNLIVLVSCKISLGLNLCVGHFQFMGPLSNLLFQPVVLGFDGPDSDNIEQVGA